MATAPIALDQSPRETDLAGPIRNAAVIGAGVMGAGIAAHLANAGVAVTLFDLNADSAAAAIRRQGDVGGFMEARFAARVTPASISLDLGRIAAADWIVEAVAERLDLKQTLFAQVETERRPGSIVSSNTSTIPLAALTDGLPDRFAADFLVTHFFNPPRSMRLLELVAGPRIRPEALRRIADFGDRALGKSVVICRDTPGFIANRIGNYWMAAAVNEAIALGLDIETADAALSRPFGIPRTGMFGLADLVGIDVIALVWRSLHGALRRSDPLRAYPAEPELVARMIAQNRLGRKSGAGFFRISADRRSREATDLLSGDYRPQREPDAAVLAAGGDPRALMAQDSPAGRYAAAVMEGTLAYAAALVPEIADGPDAVDAAMRTGYGWAVGPFELIDRLGAGWMAGRLALRGVAIPPYLARAASEGGFYAVAGGARLCLPPAGPHRPVAAPAGALSLGALRLAGAPVADWGQARLWDLGDGVACFEIGSKMNTLNEGVLSALEAALDRAAADFRALVIGSDAADFSAGADLAALLATVEAEGPGAFAARVDLGQRVFRAVKFARVPVVGAGAGRALGGGCELLLHCHAIQAHAELAMGLVEPRVGLVPAWGGCKEMLLRFATDPATAADPAGAAFDLIAAARVSGSAFEARALGFLRPEDGITMNRDRLLADAKARALALAEGFVPAEPAEIALAGANGAAALRGRIETAGDRLPPHDRTVRAALIGVLTGEGGRWPEDALSALEREAFIGLLGQTATLDRIRHMLANGKPLRN